MNSTAVDLQELKDRAKRGDLQALEELRNRDFFRKSPDGQRGFAASHGQRRLWVLQEFDTTSTAYNMPVALRIEGPLNRTALGEAFRAIVRRHESLRTTFAIHENEIRQIVHDQVDFDVEFVDLREASHTESRALQYVKAESQTPFDLQIGPLLRVKLLELAHERSILLFNIHHIVSDEWSLAVLVHELSVLYRAYTSNENPSLPTLAIQYKDYAAWHQKQVASALGDSDRRYWLSKLSGDISVLNLPTDFARPSQKTSNGQTKRISFPRALFDRLMNAARRHETSLYVWLTAIVKTLLYRYAGQQDIITGAVVSGRDHPDLEHQIGFFVNTLALRDWLIGDDRFCDVLTKVKQTIEEAFEHQNSSFDTLVDDLGQEWDPSRSPLFDVMVVLEHAERTEFELAGARYSAIDTGFSAAKFDLTFLFSESDEGLDLALNYNTDLYMASTIDRMANHLRVLLEAVVSNPLCRIADVEFVRDSERHQLIEFGRGRTLQSSTDACIHELFEQQAANTPDAIAVTCDGRELSYLTLNRRANSLAQHLRNQLGVRRENCVAVLASPSDYSVLAGLAVLKAGGAYVPIDPRLPHERIRFMIDDSRCVAVLTDARAAEFAAACGVASLVVDRWTSEANENPWQASSANGLAYVIYTSGSTGCPKGVAVEHSGFVNMIVSQLRLYGIESSDCVMQFASPSFDASVWETFLALLSGARLGVIVQQAIGDPVVFRRFLKDQQVTVALLPPSYLAALNQAELPSLKTLITGGEAAVADDARRYARSLQFFNAYGPTEASVIASMYRVEPDAIDDSEIPIGRPVENTEILILDGNLQLVPRGMPGEICLGGKGIARGYVNRPQLTAASFVPHPLRRGARLYRSGDLGRWREDGNLEFLGRKDNQLKVRGYRIEPEEVRRCLLRYGLVKQAVILPHSAHDGTLSLVAYVVSETRCAAADLRAFLAKSLPEYMVPTWFVQLDEIPLTSRGKIDTKALPPPESNARSPGSKFDLPRDEVERQLVEIWQSILEGPIGIHDNFLELGGHSLKALRIVSRVQAKIGVGISLADLFHAPTVADLASIVRGSKPVPDSIPRVRESDDYEVSFAQRRLWIIEHMGAEKAAYNIACAHMLKHRLDVAALGKALDALVDRHESLRTTFLEVDGEPRQRVHPHRQFTLALYDLRNELAGEERAHELALREAGTPFELEHGPLFRAALFQIADDRSLFLLNMHHIISDGWSLEILIAELLDLYEEMTADRRISLPPLPIQYKDYAAWQNKQLANAGGDRAYWLDQLSGEIPTIELPTDFPRPPVQSFRGALVNFSLSAGTAEELKRIGRDRGASPFIVILSLVNVFLHRYCGQKDIVVGSPLTGRGHPDLENQIGFYVNMLALRNKIRGSDKFIDVLDTVRTNVTQALEHQSYPYDRLVEELGLKRDMGRSPLFDVVVAMDDAAQKPPRTTLSATPLPLETGISKFDLTFFFSQAADGYYDVTIEYSTDLFKNSRIERMAEHFCQLANSVVQEPTDRVADLNMLAPAEHDMVLQKFNETARSYPSDRTIAGLFEEQVERVPAAPAVACGDTVLSYRALNQLANNLARYLIDENGLRHEECVGVLLDRSQWAIVALLGILKAGGAYVPIDPANPSQRIAHILRDANCRVVLCDAKRIGSLREALHDINPIDISTIPRTTGSNPPAMASSVSLAYVMYTSGSTGAAKGTLVEQKSVLRLVLNTNYVSISPGDCILQTGSLGFDASTFEIWGALLNGACVCLRNSEPLLEANELGEVIKRYGITTMFLTTGLFNQLVEADASIFEPLKTLLTGGEKVSVKHFNLLRERFPALALEHVYGPTENTTFSTWFPVRHLYKHDVPIGAPIANSTIHILDNRGLLVPVGVPGEICTGGDGLARGYLHQPALTAEKFVPHPCIPGARVYRTGDQGRWEADGTVTFIGRLDNQVKVRGYRVEPGEIESRLLRHASVNEAVVIAFDTTVGTKELAAYTAGDDSVSDAELRSFLGAALPEYMVPAYFVRMARLPLTVNGKIDRTALPVPNKTPSREYASPRSEREELLCNIWQSVLGRDRIGIVDNYLELGGDSIRAIQLVSRLQRAGWGLLVRDLFEHLTIESLAPKLRRLQHQPTSSSQPVIGPVPLTAVQRWFFQEHVGVLHHFNQAVLLRTNERLDEKWMCQVLSKLQEHHDALRMRFPSVDSQVRQINVGPEQQLGFAVVDLRDESFERAALENHANGVQSGIDLQHGPLMKAVLYRMSQSDRLLLVCHHLVVDGVSWRILLEDLAHGYAQCRAGKPIAFDDKSTSFQSWAQEVAAFAESQELLGELPYWSEAGGRANPQNELDERSHVNRYGDTDTVTLDLSAEETNRLLTDSHHAYHTQINDLLLTALGRALTASNGSRATWVTLEGHGREPLTDQMDLHRTVGWFTSLYPFLLSLPDTDIGGQIKQLKESLRRVPRKGLGYGILRYVTPRNLTQQVVFDRCPQISFNYLGKIDERYEDGLFVFAEEPSGQLIASELPRQHELDFVGLVAGGRLQISLTFNPAMHARIAVDRLMDNFKSQLRAVIDHCTRQQKSEKTLSDFAAVSADDYESILKQLNAKQ